MQWGGQFSTEHFMVLVCVCEPMEACVHYGDKLLGVMCFALWAVQHSCYNTVYRACFYLLLTSDEDKRDDGKCEKKQQSLS